MELVQIIGRLPDAGEPSRCGSNEPPRRKALLALVDADDDQALLRLRAALPDACLLDLSSSQPPHAEITPSLEQKAKGHLALTPRQSEIFALLLDGLSNKAIGRRIGISHFTVRNHVAKLMQTLDIPARRDIRRSLSRALAESRRLAPADGEPPKISVSR